MMSLGDNEKLRWGEAAVRVPTCKAMRRGRGAAVMEEDSRDRARGTTEKFIKGDIFQIFIQTLT